MDRLVAVSVAPFAFDAWVLFAVCRLVVDTIRSLVPFRTHEEIRVPPRTACATLRDAMVVRIKATALSIAWQCYYMV